MKATLKDGSRITFELHMFDYKEPAEEVLKDVVASMRSVQRKAHTKDLPAVRIIDIGDADYTVVMVSCHKVTKREADAIYQEVCPESL